MDRQQDSPMEVSVSDSDTLLRDLLEEALQGLEWWKENYPSGCSPVDDEFKERVKAALYTGEHRCPICENILEYEGQECISEDHAMLPSEPYEQETPNE